MANAKIKFFLYDRFEKHYAEIEKAIHDLCAEHGWKISGPVIVEEAVDRRKTAMETMQHERRQFVPADSIRCHSCQKPVKKSDYIEHAKSCRKE